MWKPVTEPPTEEGWYLVTWQSADKRYVESSSFSPDHGFEDRWGSNSAPIAWMPQPVPYMQ
jgi:hypothetical protein